MPVLRKGGSVLEGSGGPLVKRYFSKPPVPEGQGVALRVVCKVAPGGPPVPEEQAKKKLDFYTLRKVSRAKTALYQEFSTRHGGLFIPPVAQSEPK